MYVYIYIYIYENPQNHEFSPQVFQIQTIQRHQREKSPKDYFCQAMSPCKDSLHFPLVEILTEINVGNVPIKTQKKRSDWKSTVGLLGISIRRSINPSLITGKMKSRYLCFKLK